MDIVDGISHLKSIRKGASVQFGHKLIIYNKLDSKFKTLIRRYPGLTVRLKQYSMD